jgi:hypothetical protein
MIGFERSDSRKQGVKGADNGGPFRGSMCGRPERAAPGLEAPPFPLRKAHAMRLPTLPETSMGLGWRFQTTSRSCCRSG